MAYKVTGVIAPELIDHLAYNALFNYLGRTYGYIGQELSERNLQQLSKVNRSLLAFNELKKFEIQTSGNTELVADKINGYIEDFIEGKIV